jgi:hypothetical protein
MEPPEHGEWREGRTDARATDPAVDRGPADNHAPKLRADRPDAVDPTSTRRRKGDPDREQAPGRNWLGMDATEPEAVGHHRRAHRRRRDLSPSAVGRSPRRVENPSGGDLHLDGVRYSRK